MQKIQRGKSIPTDYRLFRIDACLMQMVGSGFNNPNFNIPSEYGPNFRKN